MKSVPILSILKFEWARESCSDAMRPFIANFDEHYACLKVKNMDYQGTEIELKTNISMR